MDKSIVFEGKEYALDGEESILNCLLRHDCQISYGCQSGVCQSCVLVVDASHKNVAGLNQVGLKPEYQSAGYVLACQSLPQETVSLRRPDSAATFLDATVVGKAWANDSVLILRLRAELDVRAGQYVTLWKDNSCARSYSVASASSVIQRDQLLEFHIRHYRNGAFSHWAATELSVGQQLKLQGPMGSCIYAAERDRPLLMLAAGTGLAPIYGILQDAISARHTGPINLVVTAGDYSQHYLLEELRDIASTQKNVSVEFLVKDNGSGDIDHLADVTCDNIYDYCKSQLGDIKEHKIIICGGDAFVQTLRKQLFLAGASLQNISTDAFLSFSPSSQ